MDKMDSGFDSHLDKVLVIELRGFDLPSMIQGNRIWYNYWIFYSTLISLFNSTCDSKCPYHTMLIIVNEGWNLTQCNWIPRRTKHYHEVS